MVNAVPLKCSGAYCATRVENWGESGETVRPQTKTRKRNNHTGSRKNKGDRKQQQPEISNARKATLALPRDCERYPPAIQLMHPAPMTRKLQNGILIGVDCWRE